MQRKEVYATTGTRDSTRVRRLGLPGAQKCSARILLLPATCVVCRWAVTCRDAPSGKAPTFMVRALRDADGANLDRVQIVRAGSTARASCTKGVRRAVFGWAGDKRSAPLRKPVGNTR